MSAPIVPDSPLKTMSDLETHLLPLAQRHYQTGQWSEAEALYLQVLEQEPERTDVLYWLGLVAEQQSNLEQSKAYYERLLEIQPTAAQVHSNLGSVLSRLGQKQAAIAHHQQAVSLLPRDADAHYNLAISLYQDGQLDAAITHYQQAIALNPKHGSAHANLALTLFAQNRLEEAIAAYERALALNPDHINAHNGLSVALYHKGRLDQAAAHCQQAIALDPDFFSAYNNLGTILQRQGRVAEAMAHYQKALALNPSYASAHDNLGTVYQERGEIEQAIAQYRQAIACDPNSANAHNNLASALKEQGCLEEAITCCHRAIQIQPNHADAYNNLGSILVEQGKLWQAIAHYETAIRHNSNHVNAHLNLGIILLMLGDYQRGFVEYHWRWRSRQCPPLKYPHALWDGSDPTGKTILLTAEQGFGDTIQFARYAPLVAQRGARVVVACQKPLLRLLETLPGIECCVDRDQVNTEVHYHAPLLDLPLILGTRVETIPANVPYLKVPVGVEVELWQGGEDRGDGEDKTENLEFKTPHYLPSPIPYPPSPSSPLKVGFAWASNPDNSTAKKRSCALSHFLSLLDVPGVVLYSLQKEPPPSDRETLAAHPRVVDLRHQLQDFADTAAAIAQMDLVVTVDTAVAHLAGALGKPVWTLLPFVADWRWLLNRLDTPWYPTMRLFRQNQDGDWEGVFGQVRQALAQGQLSVPPDVPSTDQLNGCQIKQCRHGLFLLQDGNSPEKALELYGEWLEREVSLFQPLVQPGGVVVEVGAKMGAHTLVFARAVGGAGRVVTFEPQRLTFQRLCANLALNNYRNVLAYPFAVGAAAGMQLLSPNEDCQLPPETVQVLALDSLNLARCQFLKVSGGQEHQPVLEGAIATLQRCQPVLYLEDLRSPERDSLFGKLHHLGYDLYWHRPPLFNPHNFFQSSQNTFGAGVLANVLGFHRAQQVKVQGMEQILFTQGRLESR
jgi:FkbM family methyltransferase